MFEPGDDDGTPVATTEPLEEPGLGAAVLPEFSDAAGLDQLVEQAPRRGRKPRVAQSEAPQATPALPQSVMRNALAQLDKTVSLLLKVQPEEADFINGVADTVQPIANHFAQKSESVVAMAIMAGLGLLSFAVVKYQRFRERLENDAKQAQGQ